MFSLKCILLSINITCHCINFELKYSFVIAPNVFFTFLEIREEERQILEYAGYFQSITVGIAPVVVVIASVMTFSVHLLLGYDLTAAEVSLHARNVLTFEERTYCGFCSFEKNEYLKGVS